LTDIPNREGESSDSSGAKTESSKEPIMKNRTVIVAFLSFLAQVIVFVHLSAAGDKGTGTVKVTAQKLINAYFDNPISADAQYKGKELEITGRIAIIGVDQKSGMPYFVLTPDGSPNDAKAILAVFPAKAKSTLTGLQTGQVVVVKGKCAGKGQNVMVKNCSLVK
jgi:hypothetical protein